MPSKPKCPCSHPGCPELTDSGRCEKHRKQERQRFDRDRGTAAQRGYGGRWQRARLDYLKRNPLCVECEREDRIAPAAVVDHIVPHKGNYELFWNEENWQGLCKRHHDAKTARGL